MNEADDIAKFAIESGSKSNNFHAESAATTDEETIFKSSIHPHSTKTFLNQIMYRVAFMTSSCNLKIFVQQ